MGSTRFFLADLPTRTSEADLRNLFQDYGHVDHIDLKRKEQEDAEAKVIAFVTIQTDDAHYCLNELNWQKLHGSKLRVSLAKESFLDRLKREREENQQREQSQHEAYEQPSNSQLLVQSSQNKRRVFGEDEEIGDDEVAPELLMTKKRAAHTLHNGRIVIQQEPDVKPLHVIEQHRKPAKKQADTNVSQAEQKRKESLLKMRQEHLQKKSAIQQALAGISVDGGQAKRIKFSYAEDEDEKPAQKAKKDLFENDDEDEDNEEIVLPQHKGKKGERLVEMQSKQSLDPRFRITANFVEEQEGEEEEEPEDEKPLQESERNWQMGILEQVVGRKLTSGNENAAHPAKSKKMLRFDPAKEDHQKLMRKKPTQDATQEKETDDLETERTTSKAPPPVSKNNFYVVTDTLKESLNMRGDGFSLLEMFGTAPDEEEAKRQDQLEKLGTEKILVGKASANKLGLSTLNPFSYDSSDSEDAEEGVLEEPSKVGNENKAPPAKESKQKKPKIKMESFFIPKNDPRLKEGAKFFKSAKAEVDQADYDQVRNRLKLLITNKIAKTRKNLPSKENKKQRNKQKAKP
ncbi:probable RNA-binding protein CG14230 [Drosophila bipectinata]|uniref:probable RNA-binding protein CG14230 n=1 Tax=Drosophila bipectinata TaxID=42026 RepID=UPI001C896700|nr:probable RNA-binding protein CG14230 [Drosophila bipectinata]